MACCWINSQSGVFPVLNPQRCGPRKVIGRFSVEPVARKLTPFMNLGQCAPRFCSCLCLIMKLCDSYLWQLCDSTVQRSAHRTEGNFTSTGKIIQEGNKQGNKILWTVTDSCFCDTHKNCLSGWVLNPISQREMNFRKKCELDCSAKQKKTSTAYDACMVCLSEL